MGGVVDIREGASWLPQGWVYRNVQENLADALEEQDGQLSILLRQSTIGIDYCTLTDLSPDRFQLLLFHLERVYYRTAEACLASPKQKGSFTLYLSEASVFKALLRTDPRNAEDLSRKSRIVLGESTRWAAPLWVYDFVLEQWATATYLSKPDVAEGLLNASSFKGKEECDLRHIEPTTFQVLLSHSDGMTRRYSGGFEAEAREFFAEMNPCLRTLVNSMQSDPRAQEHNSSS